MSESRGCRQGMVRGLYHIAQDDKKEREKALEDARAAAAAEAAAAAVKPEPLVACLPVWQPVKPVAKLSMPPPLTGRRQRIKPEDSDEGDEGGFDDNGFDDDGMPWRRVKPEVSDFGGGGRPWTHFDDDDDGYGCDEYGDGYGDDGYGDDGYGEDGCGEDDYDDVGDDSEGDEVYPGHDKENAGRPAAAAAAAGKAAMGVIFSLPATCAECCVAASDGGRAAC